MSPIRKIRYRLRALFRGAQLDRELDEEMRFHLEQEAREHIEDGAPPIEARRVAAVAFGGIERAREEMRDARGVRWLENLWRDVRFGARMLRKSPGFTITVVLTLAFGIAVNTTIFSMVSLFLFHPRQLDEADRLVVVMQRTSALGMPLGHSYPDFRDYREQTRTLTDLVAYYPAPAHLSARGQLPERTWIDVVTPNVFAALRVPAALGRTLLPEDGETPGSAPVIVLTHACWERQFGGDPAIVGRSVDLNGRPFTVVGVAAKGFNSVSFAFAMSGFVPVGAYVNVDPGAGSFLTERGAPVFRIMGRRVPGVAFEQARAEILTIGRQIAATHPESHRDSQVLVYPESRARPDPSFAELTVVLSVLFSGIVGMVLLIACANVTNLMLARVLSRQRELSMRAALGASRGRLVRQLLVENLLLAALAGGLGWVLAFAAGVALALAGPQSEIPTNTDFGFDWRPHVFTVVIALAAGLLSGALPALRASRINLADRLKEGGGGQVTRSRHRLRNLLVAGQVTLSVVVLVCAGLFVKSLQKARSIDLGFRTERLLLLSFDLDLQGYNDARGAAFYRDLLERVRAQPGVIAAALATHVPFDLNIRIRDVWPDDPPPHLRDGNLSIAYSHTAGEIAATAGASLLRGRALAETDDANAPLVAVVNQRFAEVCWPEGDALGKRFRMYPDGPPVEIVGITVTGKHLRITEEPQPFVLLPLAQDFNAPATLVVRAAGDPLLLAPAMREAVRSLDATLPVFNVRTMDELLRSSAFGLMPQRMGAMLSGVQGIIALLLGVIGLYSVVSFGVNQRTHEIGIRMALGATPERVVRLVVREGVRLTVIGVILGLLLAGGISAVLSHILYGVQAFDPPVFVTITLLLVGTGALACYVPARRATRVDPMIALRAE